MLEPFAFDYALMVFSSTLGVVQFVAVKNNLFGIMIFRTRLVVTKFSAIALVIAPFVWFFFLGEPRNIPDTGPGLEANTQTIVFASSAAIAIAVTFAISSIVNHSWGSNYKTKDEDFAEDDVEGMSVFQKTTFFWATIRIFIKSQGSP